MHRDREVPNPSAIYLSHIYDVAIIIQGSPMGDSCTQPESTGSVFFTRHLVSSESTLNSLSELVCRNIWIFILMNIYHIFIKYSESQI